jgi:hypothetical protein
MPSIAQSKRSLLFLCAFAFVVVPLASAQNAPVFAIEERPVGAAPRVVKAGDFNGDGRVDFVTNNSTSGTLTLRIGDGAGRFGAAADFPIGNSPSWMDVADINNDGKRDCVTCNNGPPGGLGAVLGNGAGAFGAPLASPPGFTSNNVALGDFTGDGKSDAILIHCSSNDSIATGNGLDGFTIQTSALPNACYAVVVGDWNGDASHGFSTYGRGRMTSF